MQDWRTDTQTKRVLLSPLGAHGTGLPQARHLHILNQLLVFQAEKQLQIPRANPAQLLTTGSQSLLQPGKRLLPTPGLQKQAEGLSTQATKPKVTTAGSRNNRREDLVAHPKTCALEKLRGCAQGLAHHHPLMGRFTTKHSCGGRQLPSHTCW